MRFRTKLMLGFSSLLVLTIFVFLISFLGFSQKKIIRDVQTRRTSQAIHYSNDIIDIVLTGDILQLERTMKRTCKEVDFVDYFFVIDDGGKLLAHTFDQGFPSELFSANLLPTDKMMTHKLLQTNKGRVRDFAVRTAKHMPGEIHIGMNEEIFYKHIRGTVKITILIMVGCLALGLLLVYFFTRYLTKPLQKLTSGMEKVGSWDLGYRLEEKGDYEILDLIRGYNKMASSIEEETLGLRQSENRMKAILTASPVGIGLFVNRKLDWANEVLYRMVGYEEGSLSGQNARILYPDKEAYEQAGRELYQGTEESGTNEVETLLIRKDGTTLDCRIRACSLDPKDPSKGQIVTIADISEAKRLEAQFRQAQKMEAVGRLAGGVAHDFNNLLMSIMGYADIMLMDLAEDNPFREKLEQIKGGGERAARLTRQLLAFSRKQILKPVVLDLNELIKGFVKMLERLIGEDVELETVLASELRRVEADPGQMEQVIMNLVINARDAMPDGGKLIIETVNADLDEDYGKEHDVTLQPGPYVMLAVSDTGIGMDAETRSLIFEPFFTTKEEGKGTGLGLATVYGIVKQSGGYIYVYSETGQGTTFKIYLPVVEGETVQVQKEQTSADDLTGSGTILIVEDDDALRNLAREILELQGYRILDAEDGIEALKVSEEHEGQIHLMITDVVMPKMGGKEVAGRLQPLYPQMKVIYMSGHTDNSIVHHGVLAPGLNFIGKPFSPEILVRKVREVLDKKQD